MGGGETTGRRGDNWEEGKQLGGGETIGRRGDNWEEGRQLGGGETTGSRGNNWEEGRQLGGGETTGRRGDNWEEGRQLGGGETSGIAHVPGKGSQLPIQVGKVEGATEGRVCVRLEWAQGRRVNAGRRPHGSLTMTLWSR